MPKFHHILSLLEGVKFVIYPSLTLLGKDTILKGDNLGGDQSGNHTIWVSDYLLWGRYETDVLTPALLPRDVASDYRKFFSGTT